MTRLLVTCRSGGRGGDGGQHAGEGRGFHEASTTSSTGWRASTVEDPDSVFKGTTPAQRLADVGPAVDVPCRPHTDGAARARDRGRCTPATPPTDNASRHARRWACPYRHHPAGRRAAVGAFDRTRGCQRSAALRRWGLPPFGQAPPGPAGACIRAEVFMEMLKSRATQAAQHRTGSWLRKPGKVSGKDGKNP